MPIHRTGAFMEVLEAIRVAPDPLPIAQDHQDLSGDGPVLPGIAQVVESCAERLELFSELGVSWAVPLMVADQVVAEYVTRPDLPITAAPRPYLHPVRTLGGTVVTEVRRPTIRTTSAPGGRHRRRRAQLLGRAHVRQGPGADSGWTTTGSSGMCPSPGATPRASPRPCCGSGRARSRWCVRSAPCGAVRCRGLGTRLHVRTARTSPGGPQTIQQLGHQRAARRGRRRLLLAGAQVARDGCGCSPRRGRRGAGHGSRRRWLALAGAGLDASVFAQDAFPGPTGPTYPWSSASRTIRVWAPRWPVDTPLVFEGELSRRVSVAVADGRLSAAEAAGLAAEVAL